MKRIKIIISFLCCIVLSSCNTIEYNPRYSNQSEDRVYNEETLKEILECFDNRDVETLKNMFSPYKQSEYDLEQQIEATFGHYEGISTSYEGFFDYGELSEHIQDGVCIEKVIGAEMENIKTDKDRIYFISFGKCVVCDEMPEKLGVTQVVLSDENNRVISRIGYD